MLRYGLNNSDSTLVKSIFSGYPAIHEVIIFGSRALGSFKATSDIDFAIKGDFDNSIIGSLMADFQDSDLIYEVDIVDYDRISSQKLIEHIDQHGQLIYQNT